MKELASVAACFHSPRPAAPPGPPSARQGPQVEVILVCTEPAWRFEGRELVKGCQAADMRFRGSPEQIEHLAERLRGFAAEGRRLAARAATTNVQGKEAA